MRHHQLASPKQEWYMKKMILHVVLFSLSCLSLYAYMQLEPYGSQVSYWTNCETCHSLETVERHLDTKRIHSAHAASEETRLSAEEKVIVQTIPRFHQQLSTFAPF
jgi:hypothetical protein